ncbi:MAG: tRNA glutamyl-Q(34) synthetase GluQRS [Planctomycetia bacterium]|nr:tRNA glutamyl-Q(34) synthetase GluQRS [Planctomycetia bacterium]
MSLSPKETPDPLPHLPVGRLAPSPTGAQHVGNARTYLLAWLSIRSRDGRVVLRIEDLDSPRVKAGAIQQAIDDLRWLGLDWDEGPDVGVANAPYLQTERLDLYREAFELLHVGGRVYPCTCSRSDVLAAASAPHANQEGPVYPGICASRSAKDADALADQPFSWRFHTSNTDRQLNDLCSGNRQMNVAKELGDFVIAKADGTPAYQLAVVFDDHAMGVTEVLRGDDLLPSAFRQLELYEFFGWQPPHFAHVPLVVGPDGRRLAKRHGDARLSTLREQGVSAERLLGLLAQSCGLRATAEPTTACDLLANFDLAKLPRNPFVYQDELASTRDR